MKPGVRSSNAFLTRPFESTVVRQHLTQMSLLTVGGMFTWWGTSCTADSNMDFTDLNSCVKVSTSEWFSVCSSFCNNSRALMPSNTSRTLWVEWKELLNHDRTNKAQCIFFKQVAQTKQEYLVQSDKIHAEP